MEDRTMCHHQSMTDSADHQRVKIPRAQHRQLRAIATTRGHIISMLVWCSLRTAVRAAMAGRPVPSALDLPFLPPYASKEVRWTQRRAEYDRWAQILRNHGSSPDAVIRAEITAYIASGGDAADAGEPFADLMYA